ncbi:MAG: phosphoribosylglycinamide formyltransferase [Pseudomonadota bacterium]
MSGAARKKVGVLISGRGSNFDALLRASAAPGYPAEIVTVISNRPAAAGLDVAARAGIPSAAIPHKKFASRDAFDAALTRALESAGVEIVCCAGFMRLFSESFVEAWRDRLLNIHPSLLPAYPGLDTHARALRDGVKLAGCTVHFVRSEMDRGPIVGQAAVAVAPNDTEASLAARVLKAEHQLYPECLRRVAEGRVRINDGRAVVEETAAQPPLFNPAPTER